MKQKIMLTKFTKKQLTKKVKRPFLHLVRQISQANQNYISKCSPMKKASVITKRSSDQPERQRVIKHTERNNKITIVSGKTSYIGRQ